MKTIHEYNGILFDSNEEVQFAKWLDELKKVGYVLNWKRAKTITVIDPVKFVTVKTTELKTKTRHENVWFTFLHDLKYTPDFDIMWSHKGEEKFLSRIVDYGINTKSWFYYNEKSGAFPLSYVEIKPTFDMHDKTAKFSLIQKILYDKRKIFVDLIIPEDLFQATFMPVAVMDEYRYKVITKKAAAKGKIKGSWKVDWPVRTLNEFLKECKSSGKI